MSLDFKELAGQVAKMTPEEREALGALFAAGAPPAPLGETSEVDAAILDEMMGDLRRMYPRLDDTRLKSLAIQNILRKKEKREAKPPRAVTVYFFQQHNLFVTEKTEADEEHPEMIKKTGYFLPSRVIAVDEKQAWRLYFKQRNRYGYIGRSQGQHWARARADGMSVNEAFSVEYEEFKKNPDRTPPISREKTFFAGTTPHAAARGVEIDWKAGLKQQGSDN